MIIKPKPKFGFVPTTNYHWTYAQHNIYPLFQEDGKDIFYAIGKSGDTPTIEVCNPDNVDEESSFPYRPNYQYDDLLLQKAADIIRTYELELVALTGEEKYED